MGSKVTWRRTQPPKTEDPYEGSVFVQASACYDLIVSLRALHNPRTFVNTRSWGARIRSQLPTEINDLGKFFFSGFETGLGYGALRLVPRLGPDASPEHLIAELTKIDASILAGYMLDTGEATPEALDVFSRAARGDAAPGEIDDVLRGVPAVWAKRCRRVVADPAAVQADLVQLVEAHYESVFRPEIPRLRDLWSLGAQRARDLLKVLRTSEAVEQLLGGYTLGEDLALKRITLAPSAFIYPFMSSRVDERDGEALIVYGVANEGLFGERSSEVDRGILNGLKTVADPGRLMALRLLNGRSMYGPEFVPELGITQPTVHHHLSQLRAAGLIRQKRTARGMLYTLRRDSTAELVLALADLLGVDVSPRADLAQRPITSQAPPAIATPTDGKSGVADAGRERDGSGRSPTPERGRRD